MKNMTLLCKTARRCQIVQVSTKQDFKIRKAVMALPAPCVWSIASYVFEVCASRVFYLRWFPFRKVI